MDDRLNRAEQNLDDEFGRNIFAHFSRALSFGEEFSEMSLDQFGAATLDHLEYVRRLLSYVAHERRFNFIQFALRGGEQLMQPAGKIVRVFAGDSFQSRADAGKLVGKHSLEQCGLAWKMRIKRLLADG